jgi:cell division protein FtsW
MTDTHAETRLEGAIVTSALLLIGAGMLMNYSTTAALEIGVLIPPLALRHAAGVAFALLCAWAVTRVPIAFWQRFAMPFWALSMLLLLLTLLSGVEANGARRGLVIPGIPVSIQAAEVARLATVMAVALMVAHASPKALASRALIQRVAVLVAPPVALLLFQPDFGSAVMLCGMVGIVLFAAGLPMRTLALPAVTAVVGAVVYIAVRPYARARIVGFFDPWQNAHSVGFPLVQSFVAFGRGGTTGVGLGNGRQKLFYLPEAHTDFILSVVAEAFGLVGVLVVIGAFARLCWAGLRVARRARSPFPILLATGMTAIVVLPALCNAAVVMGVRPTTGLTLPFLSHGSNSLVCSAIAIGVLLRIASESPRDAGPPRTTRIDPTRLADA